MAGAPVGNNNRNKGRMFGDALREALALPSRVDQRSRLAVIAGELVAQAEAGDLQAIREIADRLDGKPAQAIVGDPENPLHVIAEIRRKVVEGSDA